MAIGTDAAVRFYGTQDPLADSSALVGVGNFSIASDLLTWTNTDGAPEAAIILEVTMDVAAADNSGCYMYFRALAVQSTNDDAVPTAVYRHTPIAFFPVAPVPALTIQRSTVVVALPNYKTSSKWEVYIENQTGQIIEAGWTVFVTPITIGPKAA